MTRHFEAQLRSRRSLIETLRLCLSPDPGNWEHEAEKEPSIKVRSDTDHAMGSIIYDSLDHCEDQGSPPMVISELPTSADVENEFSEVLPNSGMAITGDSPDQQHISNYSPILPGSSSIVPPSRQDDISADVEDVEMKDD